MEKIIKTLKYGLLVVLLNFSISCNEEEFLNEVPLDFFSPENSYVTKKDFESAITESFRASSVPLLFAIAIIIEAFVLVPAKPIEVWEARSLT